MDDVMGLSVGSFAEDEACSWIKSTVLQLRDDHAGVMELVRYLGCLPLAIGLASAHAGVHGTSSPAEFLAAFKRVAPPPHEQLEVGAKVEMHSLNATELNGKPWRAAFPRDSITTAWRLSGQSSLLNNARFGARTLMLPPSLSSTAQDVRTRVQRSRWPRGGGWCRIRSYISSLSERGAVSFFKTFGILTWKRE